MAAPRPSCILPPTSMNQSVGTAIVDPKAPEGKASAKPFSPAAIQAIREQIVLAILDDPLIAERIGAVIRMALADRPPAEIGAAEAGQIMDLIEHRVGKELAGVVERQVRSLVRPDCLLRPHLRPDYEEHRP